MEPESPKGVEELIEEPVYVYGICHPPQAGLTLPLGLEQATRLVIVEDIAAIAEPGLSLGDLLPDDPRLLSAVLSHDRVICELFQHMPLLPLRFGTQLTSLDQLQQHLGRHALDYRARLFALGDKAEYQLKLTPQAIDLGPLPTNLKGREYFLAKKQRLQAQTQTQQQQQTDLETWLEQLQTLHGSGIVIDRQNEEVKVYLLLPPDAVGELNRQVAQWQSQTPHWQHTLSSALPPYHFV